MNDEGVVALMRAATRMADGESFSGDLLGAEGVPVALRLVVAAAVLAAADRPLTKKSVTSIAPAARSATYRDHAELLDQVTRLMPHFVRTQLESVKAGPSVTEMAKQLQEAHRTIDRERRRREEAEQVLKQFASYAAELHWRLKADYDANLKERADKVRPLRSLPTMTEEPGLDDA